MINLLRLMLVAFLLSSMEVMASDKPWSADINVSAGRNTNIGNAERNRDTVGDNFGLLSGSVSAIWGFGPQAITARGFAETERIQKVNNLSKHTGGLQLVYRRQFSPQPQSATIEINFKGQVDDYRVNQRDSTILTSQLILAKPLGKRSRISAGAEYFHRDSEGSVWDLDHVRGFLDASWGFFPGWFLYGNYSYLDGDVASSAQTQFKNGALANDLLGLIDASEEIEPDDAFNNEYSNTQWLAYRLPATTNTFKLGLKINFAANISLDLSALGVFVDAEGDNEYDVQIYRASLQKRF